MATIETNHSDIVMMIDNETLGLSPDAYITQVGLLVANVRTGELLHGPDGYWLTADGQKNRRIDPNTVRWWMGQESGIIQSVFAPPAGMARTSPQQLFETIKKIVDAHPGVEVYASPAMFDLAMLTHLWGGSKPWKYSQERDMMTLYKLLDPEGKLQPKNNGQGHNAVADAQWQMEYLIALLRRLRELKVKADMVPPFQIVFDRPAGPPPFVPVPGQEFQ